MERRVLSSFAAALVGTNIHLAIDRKVKEGHDLTQHPFPLTRNEMIKIRKATEKRERKAALLRARSLTKEVKDDRNSDAISQTSRENDEGEN